MIKVFLNIRSFSRWRSNIDTWFPYKNAKYNFDLTLCGTKDALKNWQNPNETRHEIKLEDAQLDKILDGWVSDVHKYYNDYLTNGLRKLERLCSKNSDTSILKKCLFFENRRIKSVKFRKLPPLKPKITENTLLKKFFWLRHWVPGSDL